MQGQNSPKQRSNHLPKIFPVNSCSCWLICALLSTPVYAENIKLAVASNFLITLEQLVKSFQQNSDHQVQISSGSSGVIYAQILAGAPFDLFLSADSARPQKLMSQGITRDVFSYALGQLVLWVPDSGRPVDESYLKSFKGNLAIANPLTAPYGVAALEVLAHLQLPGQPDLVKGNNIAQTYQFIHTGGAEAGFVAASQLLDKCIEGDNCWTVPPSYYHAIDQQAVLLADANSGAVEFFRFLQSPQARNIILSRGYTLHEESVMTETLTNE